MSGRSNEHPPITINQPKLIFVEGKDDRIFLNELCNYLGVINFQIVAHNGISGYPRKLKGLINSSGFRSIVTSLGIVRDAEANADSTFQSIKNALRYCNLPVPETTSRPISSDNLNVNVLILPPNRSHGSLEDVLLDSIQEDPVMPCVDQYFSCISSTHNYPTHLSKAKIQVFLASRRRCWLSLGVAAQQDYWPYTSVAFNAIREFLLNL
jgi:hypothetical protein